MSDTPLVYVVSKAIAPPFNDSTKNVVWDLVQFSRRYRYRVMTPRDSDVPIANAICEPVYSRTDGYAGGIRRNARVFVHGLFPRGARIYHYFFAPNRISSMAGAFQRRIARVTTVQTICSRPASFERAADLLFADMNIALSRSTRDALIANGVPRDRITWIYPGIDPHPISQQRKAAVRLPFPDECAMVLFPGDLEFSNAAQVVADAATDILRRCTGAMIVFACRPKTPAAAATKTTLQRQLAHLEGRVFFVDTVTDMAAFVARAHVVLLPADCLYAKMDIPLVLLEAMREGVPVVAGDLGPFREMQMAGGVQCVPPSDTGRLVETVCHFLENEDASAEMGDRGRAAVAQTFNASIQTEQIERLYDRLLADGGASL